MHPLLFLNKETTVLREFLKLLSKWLESVVRLDEILAQVLSVFWSVS